MTTVIECPTFKPSLRNGDRGQDVKELQKRLNKRLAMISDYAPQLVEDGIFGKGTEIALKYLQCLGYLKVTGLSDAATWAFICNGENSLPILRRSNTANPAVEQVQHALSEAGFYTGKFDGIFGLTTEKAVKDFQAHYALVADGVIGAKTWAELIGLGAHINVCYCQYYDCGC